MSIIKRFKARSDKKERNINFLDVFIDSDSDGLSDWEEKVVYKTDPYNPDTDGDGVSDGDEVRAGRNPLGSGKIKNIFYPNSENNYLPSILHFKKLLLLSFSAFFLKTFVIALVVFLPVTAWLSPNFYSTESEKIVNLTNELRDDLHINRLIKNEKLKQASRDKLNDVFINQYFDHISKNGRDLDYWLSDNEYDYSLAGENIAMGYKGADSIFNAWKRSEYHYNNLVNPSFTNIGVAVSDGVYSDKNTVVAVQILGSTNKYQEGVADKLRVNNLKYENVLNLTEDDKLTAPFFVIPYSNNLINTNEISLNIIAPNAEKVFVYIDDELREKEELDIFKNFWTKIKLKDGRHTIQLKSFKQDSELYSIKRVVNIDTSAPLSVGRETILAVNRLSENEYIIKAVAELEEDVVSARVQFKNYEIPLSKNTNNWAGQKIVSDSNDVFSVLINGHIIITDYAGNIAKKSIGLKNITPIKTSLLEKYSFLKNGNYSKIKFVFNLANLYLLLLMVVSSLLVLLNIKKHKKYTVFFVFLFILTLSGLMFV